MIPLKVEARVDGPVCIPDKIMLDALLAYAVILRDAIPPAAVAAEMVDVDVPILQHERGFRLCSHSEWVPERSESRWINRRPVEAEAMALGDRNRKRMQISGGPDRGYRIPYSVDWPQDRRVWWWCLGEPEEIQELLKLIGYLGKHRAVGVGKVSGWDVTKCNPWKGFPIARTGKPLRALPHPWPDAGDDGVSSAPLRYARITYPYWMTEGKQLCLVPD